MKFIDRPEREKKRKLEQRQSTGAKRGREGKQVLFYPSEAQMRNHWRKGHFRGKKGRSSPFGRDGGKKSGFMQRQKGARQILIDEHHEQNSYLRPQKKVTFLRGPKEKICSPCFILDRERGRNRTIWDREGCHTKKNDYRLTEYRKGS